jgi:3-oxoacyl-[acyl-carrier-protein] synthase III
MSSSVAVQRAHLARGPVRIQQIGTHLPHAREDNTALASKFDLSPAFVENKIGILRRARKDPERSAADLCMAALAGLDAIELKSMPLICVVTQNPGRRIPHVAAVLHNRLGMSKRTMTFDVSQGCAGYVHGLFIVAGLMDRLQLDRALMLTSDPYSDIIDPDDRDTALIFGDAATATVLAREGPGFELVDATFGTAPSTWECLRLEDHFRMDGRTVVVTATREVPPSIRQLLSRNGLATSDVDQFLLHPGSRHLIGLLRAELDADENRAPFECREYGNTVSSSLPLMLKFRLGNPSIRRLVLSGFGVGFSWGSCLIKRVQE